MKEDKMGGARDVRGVEQRVLVGKTDRDHLEDIAANGRIILTFKNRASYI
jgi:hypothetical protein